MLHRPKLLFVVTEDWFFASHFLPMAKAADHAGFEVLVATRVRDHAAIIEAAGARVIPVEHERGSLSPLLALSAVLRLRLLMKREKVALVHCIALKSILLGGLAGWLAGIRHRVLAVTGLGFLGARRDRRGTLSRRVIGLLLRRVLASKGTCFLFENSDDALSLGFAPDDPRITLVGGAGIDPELYPRQPQPSGPPLKVALVSRMLWSKGVDLAVSALTLARASGADVTLSLYGAPDPANPRAIPLTQLQSWSRIEGVTWHGRSNAIAAVWRDHHLCCLPSRGGEGLPRVLLEAAACGRAIVTTDVPGCRHFVRDGEDGIVVAPDSPLALADAFVVLANDPARVIRMGAAARTRVLDGFTEHDVIATIATLYSAMLGQPTSGPRRGGDAARPGRGSSLPQP